MPARYERQFLGALEDLFTGAEVEGKSGYINLMHIKRAYFKKHVRPQLMKNIEERVSAGPSGNDPREDLFFQLHKFFQRYFNESGSIYLRHVPAWQDLYEKVYEEDKDVALIWKTRHLYYVKSDTLVRSMPVEVSPSGSNLDRVRFYFDASAIENKRNNERRQFIFTYQKSEGKKDEDTKLIVWQHHLTVTYAENGKKNSNGEANGSEEEEKKGNGTDKDALLRALRAKEEYVDLEHLERAMRVFKKQTEVDFFIHKDARHFLREQFDMWMYQYIYREGHQNRFTEKRVQQLQAIHDTAQEIIDFISQFEDELGAIWHKPKFVRGLNYAITLDRIAAPLRSKLAKHRGMQDQIAEWQKLGLVDGEFKCATIVDRDKQLTQHRHLPIDTKYFGDLKWDLLQGLGNLDEATDGELVHSDNYQALQALLSRYKETVKCIYIDPPYNTENGDDFEYPDDYGHSAWMTMLENRLELARDLLDESGFIYLQLDHFADYYGRILLQNLLPRVPVKDQTVITWNTGENVSGFKTQRDNWIRQADKILCFPKNPDKARFVKLWWPLKAYEDQRRGWLDFIGPEKNQLYIEKWQGDQLIREPIEVKAKRLGTVWNDIYSFQYSEPRETESFSFMSQKPENLIRRIIQSCTEPGDLVLDFFAGTGTTPAVAHKLKRKWLAVESAEHINDFYVGAEGTTQLGLLGRLKLVLAGDRQFTLPDNPVPRSPHLSKDINWQGGGVFKYYRLEQYEEVLARMHYKESSPIFYASRLTPFQQYVFRADDKFAQVVEANKKNDKLDIKLDGLYDDIDLAECLANVLGEHIRTRDANEVRFVSGRVEKINPGIMNTQEKMHFINLMRPYLWWGA